MLGILGSSMGAFFAAKRSHFAVLAICIALILEKATTKVDLLIALDKLCGKPLAPCKKCKKRGKRKAKGRRRRVR